VGDWERLHNVELHNMYTSPPNIFRVSKSKKLRWAAHVARMREITVYGCGQ
jgi:hypothetical protein